MTGVVHQKRRWVVNLLRLPEIQRKLSIGWLAANPHLEALIFFPSFVDVLPPCEPPLTSWRLQNLGPSKSRFSTHKKRFLAQYFIFRIFGVWGDEPSDMADGQFKIGITSRIHSTQYLMMKSSVHRPLTLNIHWWAERQRWSWMRRGSRWRWMTFKSRTCGLIIVRFNF